MGFPVNVKVRYLNSEIFIGFEGSPKRVLDINSISMRFSTNGNLHIKLVSAALNTISKNSVLHKIKNSFEKLNENYESLFTIETDQKDAYLLATEGYDLTHQQKNRLVNDFLTVLQAEVNLSNESMLSIKAQIKKFFPLQPVENQRAEASPQPAATPNTVRTLFNSSPNLSDMVEVDDDLNSLRSLNSSPA